jgi:pilus assembly protein CpaB
MARTVAAGGRTNRRFLLIAILFAALSGALIYAWMASQGGSDDGGGSTATGSQQVVVAKQAIRERTKITSDMLTLKSIPTNAVVAGGYTTLEEVEGLVTKLPIEANSQVVASSVIDTSRPTTDHLAQLVPTGKRGFSIGISEVHAAGGLILPGDYVDVIWTCCTAENKVALTRTILQNVQVAAIAQNLVVAGPTSGTATEDGEGAPAAPPSTSPDNPVAATPGEGNAAAGSATLLVTQEQSHLLVMAGPTGNLHLALRGVGDSAIIPPAEEWTLPEEILQTLPPGLWPDGYKEDTP